MVPGGRPPARPPAQVRHPFNAQHERERKRGLELLMQRSREQDEAENEVLQQAAQVGGVAVVCMGEGGVGWGGGPRGRCVRRLCGSVAAGCSRGGLRRPEGMARGARDSAHWQSRGQVAVQVAAGGLREQEAGHDATQDRPSTRSRLCRACRERPASSVAYDHPPNQPPNHAGTLPPSCR